MLEWAIGKVGMSVVLSIYPRQELIAEWDITYNCKNGKMV
jgi:hypothetical protein